MYEREIKQEKGKREMFSGYSIKLRKGVIPVRFLYTEYIDTMTKCFNYKDKH